MIFGLGTWRDVATHLQTSACQLATHCQQGVQGHLRRLHEASVPAVRSPLADRRLRQAEAACAARQADLQAACARRQRSGFNLACSLTCFGLAWAMPLNTMLYLPMAILLLGVGFCFLPQKMQAWWEDWCLERQAERGWIDSNHALETVRKQLDAAQPQAVATARGASTAAAGPQPDPPSGPAGGR